jgi:hypothetical protein
VRSGKEIGRNRIGEKHMSPEEKLKVIELLEVSYQQGWDNALSKVAIEILNMKAFPDDTTASFAVFIQQRKGKYERPAITS